MLPERALIVGTRPEDVAAVDPAAARPFPVEVMLSERPGLPIQRNVALDRLAALGAFAGRPEEVAVVFFDDDFRPKADWLAGAVALLSRAPEIAGLTGLVLADGIKRGGLAEADAAEFLEGRRPPEAHWASGTAVRDVSSAYGCNMAFRGTVAADLRFDERLPLYGWQEDRDFTGQVLRRGRVVFAPGCIGVHLGIKGARTSEVRLGFSQIANVVYLMRKGTMGSQVGLRFLARSLAANALKSLARRQEADHRGRLKGNLLALADLARGRCRPERILEL